MWKLAALLASSAAADECCSCVSNAGGVACADGACSSRPSSCTQCIINKGGLACEDRCCGGAAVAGVGVDVSDLISVGDWECLSPDFAIARVYQSLGRVDTAGISSIKNALAHGIANVGGYMFPCVSCGDAAGQVKDAVDAMKQGGATGMLWYDVEIFHWTGSTSANRAFVKEMIDTGMSLGVKAGVYTNQNNWGEIVGLDWTYAADQGLPLWYAHYDNVKAFSDFSAFGGWSAPAIKQYAGDKTQCGIDLDYNWAPASATTQTLI